MQLNSNQFQVIRQYVQESELQIHDIQEDVIDHLCCMTENIMSEGLSFEEAFSAAKNSFSESDLKSIQEDTIYYLTIQKSIIMIKTIFISGYLSVMLYVLSSFSVYFSFLTENIHFITFGMKATSVLIFCFVFLPALFLFGYRKSVDGVKA